MRYCSCSIQVLVYLNLHRQYVLRLRVLYCILCRCTPCIIAWWAILLIVLGGGGLLLLLIGGAYTYNKLSNRVGDHDDGGGDDDQSPPRSDDQSPQRDASGTDNGSVRPSLLHLSYFCALQSTVYARSLMSIRLLKSLCSVV